MLLFVNEVVEAPEQPQAGKLQFGGLGTAQEGIDAEGEGAVELFELLFEFGGEELVLISGYAHACT